MLLNQSYLHFSDLEGQEDTDALDDDLVPQQDPQPIGLPARFTQRHFIAHSNAILLRSAWW